ncbi:MAG: protein kinase [Candidatus Eremiobacteraeota bacterium]|nr:protein kinase [Candidatus Eremiobacteraeota bacterium]
MPEPLPKGTALNEGRYEITKLLGQSNFSHIYMVKDTKQNKTLLVKELFLGDGGEDFAAFEQHFLKAAHELSSISHHCLPRLIDYFSDGSRCYYVREFIEGKTFSDLLKQGQKSFSENQLRTWFSHLVESFSSLRAQTPPLSLGPVRPSNVIITPMGKIRILDFGIDRFFPPLTKKEVLKGSISSFSAPESTGEREATEKGDVYSLGALFYHVLTARVPGGELDFSHQDEKMLELMRRLEGPLRKSLESDPGKRYDSLDEFRNDIAGAFEKKEMGNAEMVTSIKEIDLLTVKPHEEIQGKIHVMNVGGGLLAGRTWVDANWISLSSQVFNGNDLDIGYTIKTDTLELGVPHTGTIVLETRNQKKTIPVRIIVEPQGSLELHPAAVFLILLLIPMIYAFFVSSYLTGTVNSALSHIREVQSMLLPARELNPSIISRLRFSSYLLYFFPWSSCFLLSLIFIRFKPSARVRFFPLYILALSIPLIWFFVRLSLEVPLPPSPEIGAFLKNYGLTGSMSLGTRIMPFCLIGGFSFAFYLSRATESVSRFCALRPSLDYLLNGLAILAYLGYFIAVMFLSLPLASAVH